MDISLLAASIVLITAAFCIQFVCHSKRMVKCSKGEREGLKSTYFSTTNVY